MTTQVNPSANSSAAFSAASGTTVDRAEIEKFSKLSQEWWDPNGKMAPLHRINPLRLQFIRDAACRKFDRNARSLNCLAGLRLLDIGCGAGLLCEPFTRLGAQVIGVDPSASNIAAAKLHAEKAHLSIDYRCATVEDMDVRERFDIIRRRRVRAALAAARHASVGQVRHSGRTRAPLRAQRARHHRAVRRGL